LSESDSAQPNQIRAVRRSPAVRKCSNLVRCANQIGAEPGSVRAKRKERSKLASMTQMRLYDIRVTVERIEGRSVCGLAVGDYFEVTESNRVRIPEGKHFCLYALNSVLPFIPAKQRQLPAEDWLEQDSLVACPDPDECVVLRIERIGERTLVTEELT
jgi:uncharacterized repeat protein (TIGR04076 family)